MDSIVYLGHLKVYQEGDEVEAWSEYGAHGLGAVAARGADVQAAIDALAVVWQDN
jgi:hypothetical protein